MTLADFIIRNVDEILAEWVEFARALESGRNLELDALRDHAKLMLLTVAREMATEQSDAQQKAKSRGEGPIAVDSATEAHSHGDQRYGVGFDLEELVAEYRALRATVIRLWISRTSVHDRSLYELTRFNEGIDQLLAESVMHFSQQIDRARQLFMGVLGHDLRTDLAVIMAGANRLQRHPTKEQIEKYVPYMKQSTSNILAMIEDLLDVTRTRLGAQLPIDATRMDAKELCERVLEPFRELYSGCRLRLNIEGDVTGQWDRKRLHQLLSNLVRNAFQHGDAKREITLSAQGDENSVTLRVHNFGPAIPPSLMAHIFDPLRRREDPTDSTSLGLGLYIAHAVAQAHRGRIGVASSADEGTTFTVVLPKDRSADAIA